MGNAPTAPRQSLHQTLAARGLRVFLTLLRRSVVMALFSSNRMKGAWASQARYVSRPEYRVHKRRHPGATAPGQPREPHVFLDPAVLSTGVTQPAARTFGEAPNWARYSWVIAKAASRGGATSITHCSKTGAVAARSRLALCFSAPDTGRGRGRQIDTQLSRDYSRKEHGATRL